MSKQYVIVIGRQFGSGGRDWGSIDNYDLCLNSAKLGIDGTVDLLAAYVAARNA